MTIIWKKWSDEIVNEHHKNIYYYRDLYEGNHVELFPRARKLKKDGEIVSDLIAASDKSLIRKGQVPYIVANVSALIAEIPAMLVSRAIGRISPANDTEHTAEIRELQKAIIEEITEDSELSFEHYTNILQHQIDGGLVGIVTKEIDDIPIIETKARDVYFPHDDGRGADIALVEKYPDHEANQQEDEEDPDLIEYLHIYRERIERSKERDKETKKRKSKLICTHILYKIKSGGSLEEVEEETAAEMLGVEELETVYEGRSRGFIRYWANNKTFSEPLGRSALRNQESKQEEINWTLTRNAIVYQQNGKPRIAVNKRIFKKLADIAYDRHGDEAKIEHEDIEIFEMDDNGKSIEVFQLDISKIGNIEWVKDLMKMMFVETQTSEKAVDFYLEDGGSPAQSGVAKFYDLFTSLIKAEKIAKEYIAFLQDLYEGALWMERELGDIKDLPIEKPDIHLIDMIPIARKELIEQESLAYEKKIQSRYESVKRIKPNDSEASIEDEVATIEEENSSDDSNSLLMGRKTLNNFMDNRDANGNPIDPNKDEDDEDEDPDNPDNKQDDKNKKKDDPAAAGAKK